MQLVVLAVDMSAHNKIPKVTTNVASARCASCDRMYCSVDNPDCPYYGCPRLPHADAQPGDNVPHMLQMAIEFVGDGIVEVDQKRFRPGDASSESCNCLIDTLRQVLHLQCDLSGVRRHLMTLFPDGPGVVTPSNFLELELHWAQVVDALAHHTGQSCSSRDLRVKCAGLSVRLHV